MGRSGCIRSFVTAFVVLVAACGPNARPPSAQSPTPTAGGLGLALFRQMAMSNYGGIATVVLVVLALIILAEIFSYYARRAVI